MFDRRGINGGMIPRRIAAAGEAVAAYVCTIDVAALGACAEASERQRGEDRRAGGDHSRGRSDGLS